MSLVTFKVALKLRWKKHCALAAAGVENADTNSNNITFIIKDTKLFIPVVALPTKDNQNILKLLS